MLKWVSIGLLICFVVETTSLKELWYLPELLEHFQEHSRESGMNFTEFVYRHYVAEKTHSHPNNNHENLPFKLHHVSFACMGAISIYPPTEMESPAPPVVINESLIHHNSDIPDWDLIQNVFHPPKC